MQMEIAKARALMEVEMAENDLASSQRHLNDCRTMVDSAEASVRVATGRLRQAREALGAADARFNVKT